ncbi:MAG: hypothetical protein N3B11_05130, partial [Coriobacteriia bacterium]|nr:hypothetical protein [Coriobacteriia bacterium]
TYEFTVRNNTPTSGVFDLLTSSTLGWPNTVTDTSGNPISTLALGPGQSKVVRVRMQVPTSAAVGAQDVTRLTATLQGSPAVSSSATAVTTVQQGLTIVPSQTGYGGAGSFVQYTHTVTNSWPTTRTISLSAASSLGWTARIFASDGVTQISQITLGPNGASGNVIVRIFIPAGAASGAQDQTTVTASVSGTSASVIDRTIVRRLLTYEDGGFVNQSSSFVLGDTVYARATGLSPGSSVYFVFKDANGAIVRTTPLRTVDTQGMAFDQCVTLGTHPVGDWVVELYSSGGTLLERAPFVVMYDAEITTLSATDAPKVGDRIAVTSSTVNRNPTPISNSTMTYVIWWDTNGDGTFGAGDTYIDGAGKPRAWDGSTSVSTHVTTGITVAGGGTWSESRPWTMPNTGFPNQGTYRVTATWKTSTGRVIDVATTQLYSIPTLGWPLLAATLAGAAYALWRRRASSDGGGQA